jgi:DNA-binding NarL/FixJ family response regulator
VAVPRRTILVAEDYAPFRDFISEELQSRCDGQVVFVADGAAAVRTAVEMRPDLALLDVGLPEISGLAAAREIRARCPETRIVFVSQEQSPDIVAAALDLGARGYILKMRAPGYLRAMADVVLDGEGPAAPDSGGGAAGTGRGHSVQFFADDSVLLDTTERIILAALERGDAAIAALTRSHLDALDARLRRRPATLDRAMTLGTLAVIDVDRLVATIGTFGEADWSRLFDDFAATVAAAGAATGRPQPRVAIVGEIGPALLAAGRADDSARMERIGHELVMSPMLPAAHLTCVYPLLPPTDASLTRICATHSPVTVR